jgi:hypothetical protein
LYNSSSSGTSTYKKRQEKGDVFLENWMPKGDSDGEIGEGAVDDDDL